MFKECNFYPSLNLEQFILQMIRSSCKKSINGINRLKNVTFMLHFFYFKFMQYNADLCISHSLFVVKSYEHENKTCMIFVCWN